MAVSNLPTFYVTTGEHKVKVNAFDPRDAARRAIAHITSRGEWAPLGKLWCASAVGFNADDDDDMFGLCAPVLDELGVTYRNGSEQ